MSSAIRTQRMSRDEFLLWADAQGARYEFDGVEPLPMTEGTNNRSLICQNLWFALCARLRGSGCVSLGPDAGLATAGDAIRYSDAVVSCGPVAGEARLASEVRVIFEVLSPTSGRTDRITKVREYAAVPSIQRHVILEYTAPALTCLERERADTPWTATVPTADDTLRMPEIGVEIPVIALYEAVELPPSDGASG